MVITMNDASYKGNIVQVDVNGGRGVLCPASVCMHVLRCVPVWMCALEKVLVKKDLPAQEAMPRQPCLDQMMRGHFFVHEREYVLLCPRGA